MFKQSLLAVAIVAAGLGTAHADDLSYSYIQGSYSQTEFDADDFSLDLNGFDLTGSFAVSDHFFVQLNAGRATGDERIEGVKVDTELDGKTLMLGFHTALSDNLDFVASIGKTWLDAKIDVDGFGEFEGDDDANLVSVGLRGMATDSLELFANAVYVDGDGDSDTNLNVGGMYKLSSNFGIGLSHTAGDDADTTGVFARLSF